MNKCPCCNGQIAWGLFAYTPRVAAPLALAELLSEHQAEARCADGVALLHGRAFVECRGTLPLHQADSPVAVQVWVELREQQFGEFAAARAGRKKPMRTFAHLACDWPGFPGSVGAPVLVEADRDSARIVHCADQRIMEIGRRRKLAHDEFAALYRQVWGGEGDPAQADDRLRAAAVDAFTGYAGAALYCHPVEPPPRFAGVEPAAVLERPPHDTGAEVLLATVGIAEATEGARAVELVGWMRNPSAQFQRAFSELCYWSRRSSSALKDGTVIANEAALPQTAELTSWLVCEPWWTDVALPRVDVDGRSLEFLAAVPISRAEQQWAERRGSGELLSRLRLAGDELFDLQRPSTVS